MHYTMDSRIRIDFVMCLGLIGGVAIQVPQLQLQLHNDIIKE